MDVQVDFLISSVEKSLTSLQGKRDFLEEQKIQYNNIHDKLVAFQERQRERSDKSGSGQEESEEEEKGMILGDVIISANKVFLNLGYEYYIEKTSEEVLEFIDDKLRLMVEAIEQFDLKIGEGKGTLKNLKQVQAKQSFIDETDLLKQKDSNSNNNDDDDDDNLDLDIDTEFPTMEIREELDEDGNVINSSVRPTKSSKTVQSDQIEEVNTEETQNDSFENNLKGKLLPKTEPSQIVEHFETPEMDSSDPYEGLENNPSNNVDTENIYSFADLVQQMDEQDDLEDGNIGEDDIEYDYDRYTDHMENMDNQYDEENEEEEEDDDDLFAGHMNMVPGRSGQSSFMDQIAKLRAAKNGVSTDDHIVEDEIIEKDVSSEIKPLKKSSEIKSNKKSILKPSTVDFDERIVDISKPKETEADTNKPNDEKKEKMSKKPKKSVGFAAQLDIHEVESFKEETKKQTHNLFPTAQQLMFSNLVGVKDEDMVDDTHNPNIHNFDSDLFASLLGVKGSEEIHDKYNDVVEREVKLEEEKSNEHVAKKKTRVSRFKKDKSVKKPQHEIPQITDDIVERDIVEKDISTNDIVENNTITNDIIERDIIEHEPITNDIIERDIVENMQSMSITSDIVEKDITEHKPVTNDIIEKDIIEHEPVTNDIIEKDISEHIPMSKPSIKSPLFKKQMKSLRKPNNQPKSHEPLITPEMLDSMDFSDDDEKGDKKEPTPVSEPKIVELKPGEEEEEVKDDENNEEIFPSEVKTIINQMGKDEDDVRVANVDYSALNENMDDMVKAYSLGLYDDDLEEHPGTVLEKLEDFTLYNEQAELLKDTIKEFKKNNPIQPFDGETEEEPQEVDDGKIMTDEIQERELPEDYDFSESKKPEGVDLVDNYGLDPDNLQDSINLEYHRLKASLVPRMRQETEEFRQERLAESHDCHDHDHDHSHNHIHKETASAETGIEPVDADGNPIKISKFKAQRLRM